MFYRHRNKFESDIYYTINMSEVNCKNQIQEYCHKHKQQLPVYSIETITTIPPLFKCTLTVFDREFITEGCSKKIASFAAATQAIQYMEKEGYYEINKITTPDYSTIILIDVENIPRIEHHIIDVKNVLLILVGRRDHPAMKILGEDKQLTDNEDVLFSEVLFNRKDAADIVMCIEIGRILEALPIFKKYHFILVSNDHFVHSVKDYINMQTDHNAYVANDIESIINAIDMINCYIE